MSPTLIVRQATSRNAERIHELHTNSVQTLCKDHYSSEQITGWLKNRTPQGYLAGIERGEMFVVVEAEHIVGFGHAVPGEVVAVYVDPERVRRGVGQAILVEGIARARKGHHGAVRLDATLNAQNFYEKAGFVALGRKVVKRNEVLLPLVMMELRDGV